MGHLKFTQTFAYKKECLFNQFYQTQNCLIQLLEESNFNMIDSKI